MDHNEDIDKEIRIALSILWDIAVQGGNEVMRYLSLYLSMARSKPKRFISEWNYKRMEISKNTQSKHLYTSFIYGYNVIQIPISY